MLFNKFIEIFIDEKRRANAFKLILRNGNDAHSLSIIKKRRIEEHRKHEEVDND